MLKSIYGLPTLKVNYKGSDKKYFFRSTDVDVAYFKRKGYMEVPKEGERRLLNRPASVEVTFAFGGTEFVYDAKKDVERIYGLTRISEKAAKKFHHDLMDGNIVLSAKGGKLHFEKIEETVKQAEGNQLKLF